MLISSFNAGGFIGDAIESALNQTLPGQVVVVDDGSSDDSRAIIESFGSRITPILKENGGQYSCHNAGVQRCAGDVIAFLDGDDVFAPNKLEWIVHAMHEHPDAASCFHPRIRESQEERLRIGLTQRGLIDFRRRASVALMPNILTTTSGIAIRRTALDRIFPLPEDMRIPADDHVFKWAILSAGPSLFVDAFLAVQRMHTSNYSADYEEQGRAGVYSMIRAELVRSRYPHLHLWADRVFADGESAWRRADGSGADATALSQGFRAASSRGERLGLSAARLAFDIAAKLNR